MARLKHWTLLLTTSLAAAALAGAQVADPEFVQFHPTAIDIGRDPAPLATEALRGIRHLIVVGTRKPVNFFAYPGKPATAVPDGCAVHVLARPEQDVAAALAGLAELLAAPPAAVPEAARPAVGRGRPPQHLQSRQ